MDDISFKLDKILDPYVFLHYIYIGKFSPHQTKIFHVHTYVLRSAFSQPTGVSILIGCLFCSMKFGSYTRSWEIYDRIQQNEDIHGLYTEEEYIWQ